MKLIIIASLVLLAACSPYKKAVPPLMYDPATDETRACAHIGILGDCKHFM